MSSAESWRPEEIEVHGQLHLASVRLIEAHPPAQTLNDVSDLLGRDVSDLLAEESGLSREVIYRQWGIRRGGARGHEGILRPLPNERRAWAYLRISKDDAGDELGVDRQRSALSEYAADHGWHLAGVFQDNDISASTGKRRPGYQGLLAAVRPGDVILCTETSRLTRRPREMEDLIDLVERTGVEIVATRAGRMDLQTPDGRTMARILGSIDRGEVERMAARVKAKHKQNADQGRAPGGSRPYGYRRTGPGVFEVNEEEAQEVRWMAEQVLNGMPVNAIVRSLNEREIRSSTGKDWRAPSVTKLLTSPRNAGRRTLNGADVTEGKWPAILDEVTFKRVLATLTPAPDQRRPRHPRVNLLAGFLRCGATRDGRVCGAPMHGHTSGRPRNAAGEKLPRYAVYSCNAPVGAKREGQPRCEGNAIVAKRVEDLVIDALLGDLSHVNLAEARARREEVDVKRLLAEITQDEEELKEVMRRRARREISPDQELAFTEIVERRLAENRAALAAVSGPPLDLEYVDDEVWESLTFDQKRGVLGLRIDHVTIAKGRRGRNFDESRVKIFWKP